MASVNELVNRLTTEHPGVPRTAVQSLLDNQTTCVAFTAPGCTKSTVAEALRGSAHGDAVVEWLGGLQDGQCDSVLQKLKIIATTSKLIGMLPAAMQGNVEKMIKATSAAQTAKTDILQKGKAAVSNDSSNNNNAAAAMDMLNNIMGSGLMEQMQDMTEGGDEEYEQMCEDVKQLKKEVKDLRRLVLAITKKLPASSSKSKRK